MLHPANFIYTFASIMKKKMTKKKFTLYTFTCEICGRKFKARMSNAVTCSPSCRSLRRHRRNIAKIKQMETQKERVVAREERVNAQEKRVNAQEKRLKELEKRAIAKFGSTGYYWQTPDFIKCPDCGSKIDAKIEFLESQLK